LLFKVGLVNLLTDFYEILIVESVRDELLQPGLPGADVAAALCKTGAFRVIEKTCSRVLPEKWTNGPNSLDSLDAGERDSVKAYFNGFGDLIITDDGKASVYCKRNNIPFINALLFPRILEFSGLLPPGQAQLKMRVLSRIGRYSQNILDYAAGCRVGDVEFFLPTSDAYP